MSTRTIEERTGAVALPAVSLRLAVSRRLFGAVALVAMVVGGLSVAGGIAGAVYTWDQAAAQDITTPEDARLAEVAVRGPLSMWAQADIITRHQLESTGGRYYAEMERLVPQLDEAGEPVLDAAGEPVLVPNEARDSWITATALTTALGLGMLAYAFSAFAVVMGLALFGVGLAVFKLNRAPVAVE